MPSLTDSEMPGPRCLARIAENFRMGDSCSPLEWKSSHPALQLHPGRGHVQALHQRPPGPRRRLP
eukprot:8035157-Heterocapsa_arctica.AAC.1